MSLRTSSVAVLTAVCIAIPVTSQARAQPAPNPYDAPNPPSPRRAGTKIEPKGPEWSIFVGAWVQVKRTDGTVVRGRMWRISDRLIVVNLGRRSTVIPVTQIAMLRRLAQRPTPTRPQLEAPPTRGTTQLRRRHTPPPRKLAASPKQYHVEWFTLFAFGGGGAFGWGFDLGEDEERYIIGGVELGLFSIVWRHAYFDILRLSGGVPYLVYLGTAFGLRGLLDKAEKYELRLGLHLSCPYQMMFMPTMSGLDIKLLIRLGRDFRVQLGLKVFSFPPAAVAGVGFSY